MYYISHVLHELFKLLHEFIKNFHEHIHSPVVTFLLMVSVFSAMALLQLNRVPWNCASAISLVRLYQNTWKRHFCCSAVLLVCATQVPVELPSVVA